MKKTDFVDDGGDPHRWMRHTCPFCGTYAKMGKEWGTRGGLPEQQFVYVYVCPCNARFVAIIRAEGRDFSVYPLASTARPEAVPNEVYTSLAEAEVCLQAGQLRAAVVMARRCLQAACLNKGCTKDDPVNQIKQLEDKKLLLPHYVDAAHQVRKIGNIGAHPDEDGLETVSTEEASEIIDYARTLLDELYVNPARIAKFKAEHP